MKVYEALRHTTWECKYHAVIAFAAASAEEDLPLPAVPVAA